MLKLLGLLLGGFISFMLLWQLFPFLSESMEAITDNPILGQGERGAVLLIPAIVIIIIVVGFAMMVRKALKN